MTFDQFGLMNLLPGTMRDASNKKKAFPWRRYVLLIVGLALIGRTLWLLPRKSWSLKYFHHTTLTPKSEGKTSLDTKNIRRIVLISIDTCRADHLGCYGYSRKTSPNIDALATESFLFNHAVAPAPMTLPSHCSMLTGTTPPYHQVHDNTNYRLGGSNVTLAEILRDNGFVTGAIIGAYVLDAQFGLDQGFHHYNDRIDKENREFLFRNERPAEEVTYLANQWLEKHSDDKFFLFLHYYDPHDPYEAHKRFRFTSLLTISFERDQYDAEIAYTDHYIGQVIDKLKEMGLYEDTLIIITSDHGESFGEHGEKGHSYFIYHSTVHVPLIVKVPGQSGPRRINDVVGLIDIVPTVCGMLGIRTASQVEGEDLSYYFGGGKLSHRDRHLYCESLTPRQYNGEPLRGLVTNRYKYIQTVRPELYDLVDDHRERDNVIKDQPQTAENLRKNLMRILGSTIPASTDSKIDLNEQALKRLQSLGYVAGTVNKKDFELNQVGDDPKDLIDFHNSYQELINLIFMKQYGQAKKLAQQLISQRPQFYGTPLTTLAWILATHPDAEVRDADKAVILAEHAVQITENQDGRNLDALAAAYAATGQYERAVTTAKAAIRLASERGDFDRVQEIHKRVEIYRQKKTYLEPP